MATSDEESPDGDGASESARARRGAASLGGGERLSVDDPDLDRVLELVSERPGLTASEISQALEQSPGDVDGRLNHLAKHGLATTENVSGTELWFPADVDEVVRRALTVLRRPGVRDVAVVIFQSSPGDDLDQEFAEREIDDKQVDRAVDLLQDEELLKIVEQNPQKSYHLHPKLRIVIARWLAHSA